jgi:hypothetical protein
MATIGVIDGRKNIVLNAALPLIDWSSSRAHRKEPVILRGTNVSA